LIRKKKGLEGRHQNEKTSKIKETRRKRDSEKGEKKTGEEKQ